MQAIQSPSLADVRKLPSSGVGRERQLHHLVDLQASTEAAAALHSAASRASGATAVVLNAADAVIAGSADAEAARDRLREVAVSNELLSLLPAWIHELRETASTQPEAGACTVASALELWSWTIRHFAAAGSLQVTDELADTLHPLLAARSLALEMKTPRGPQSEIDLQADLCRVYAARAAASAGATCAELVFGYRKHLVWDAEGCATCFDGDDVDALEAIIPGIASGARMSASVVEADGTHPVKAGPCVRFDGVETFVQLRSKLDGCLTGARLAKDRAAAAIARSMTALTEGKA